MVKSVASVWRRALKFHIAVQFDDTHRIAPILIFLHP